MVPDPTRVLEDGAANHPERPFIAAPFVVSYRDAAAAVRRYAAVLAASGLRRGERLLIVAPNRVETVLLVLAALRGGHVFVLLHPTVGRRALQWTLGHCRPGLVVLDPATAHLAPAIAPGRLLRLAAEPDLDLAASGPAPESGPAVVADGELAALIYTSGTTGRPRGVMVSRSNLRFTVAAIRQRLRYGATDVVGLFLPLSFDYGLYQSFLVLAAGATLVVGEPRQAGPQLAGLLARQRVSVLPGTPRLLAGLARLLETRPRPLQALRLITSTGDHLPEALIRRLRRLLPAAGVAPMYGLTECKRISILTPQELAARPGSVGRALEGTELVAVDPRDRPLPPGKVGELRVRGPHVTLGYWRAGAETARRFRPAAGGGRELATGDLCHLDGDGYVTFVGRRDGQLKHHGFRIDPWEIERTVREVPGIREAAVVRSSRDDRLHLFVTGGDDSPLPSLLPRLRGELESFKLPEAVHRLRELPTTANGKVDRRRLVRLAEGMS